MLTGLLTPHASLFSMIRENEEEYPLLASNLTRKKIISCKILGIIPDIISI